MKLDDTKYGKLVKARKNYDCCFCDNGIKKGDLYYYNSTRIPVFRMENALWNQIGIEYLKTRVCEQCGNELISFEENKHARLTQF